MPFSQEQRSFILEQPFASRSYAQVKDEFCSNYPDVVVNHADFEQLFLARISFLQNYGPHVPPIWIPKISSYGVTLNEGYTKTGHTLWRN